jgi:serine/threonine protein phosphatase PrpC
MEKLLLGSKIKDSAECGGANHFSDFFVVVKKGHDECGDSAFVYSDEEKTILGIFDGVSGEAGAAEASSAAAAVVLGFLRTESKLDEKRMEAAVKAAQGAIKSGLTTLAVAFVRKDGSFILAGVGDSPVYGVDKKGAVSLEIPLSRAVKDKDAILKYFFYRNLLSSALGPESSGSLAIRSGKLERGEMLILASDGISDNLFVKTDDGFVTDSSGCDDLAGLVKGKKSAKAIAESVLCEVQKRISSGKIEWQGKMLVPKEDDLSITVIRKL